MTNETEYGYRNRNDPNSRAISSLTAYSKDKEESMNRRTFFTLHPCRAKAYLRDNPNATVQLLVTEDFALETHVEEIALAMKQFLAKKGS